MITIAKIEAGSTRNVIPETARMLGTIRTVSDRTRERVLDGVDHLIKHCFSHCAFHAASLAARRCIRSCENATL